MAEHAPLKKELLDALKLRYTAQVYEAKATLEVYLTNPAGIGEHPQIIDEMSKQLEKYCNAVDALTSLQDLYGDDETLQPRAADHQRQE